MKKALCAIVLLCGCNERNPRFDEGANGSGDASNGSASDDGGSGDGTSGNDDGAGDDGGSGSGGTQTDDDGGTETSGGVGSGTTTGLSSASTGPWSTSGTETTAGSGTAVTTTGPMTTSGSMTSTGPMTTTGGLSPLCDAGDLSLVACFEFEAVDSGMLIDGSSYGNDGIGSGVSTDAGISGKAGVFSNISKLAIPDATSLNPTDQLTIDMWIRPAAFPAVDPDGVVDKDGQWWVKITDNQKIHCGFFGIGSLTGGSLSAGTWTHVTCLYDGNQVRMYQDGQPRGMVGTPRALATGALEIILGNEGPGLGNPYRGLIDRLRIWNRGLTPAEVCAAAGQTGC